MRAAWAHGGVAQALAVRLQPRGAGGCGGSVGAGVFWHSAEAHRCLTGTQPLLIQLLS